jgi:hypothetical protein
MPDRKSGEDASQGILAASRSAAAFPFRLLGRSIARTIQVVFALFVLVLHPQIKWLIRTIGRSSLVQNYIKPALRGVIENVYEPYFAYLRGLPPIWATFSIALPLAVLEPAKFVATILIAARPKMGVLLWLLLQGVSFVLIDRTWVAVRPQARKIWLVSRLHALVFVNVAYGKHWIKTSAFYQTLVRWKEEAHETLRAFFARWAPRRGGKQNR